MTDSTERGRVTSTGNFGINTTTPGLRTHIVGALGFPATSGTTQTGVLRLQGTGSGGVLDFSVNGGSGASLQMTNLSSLSSTYPLMLNPNGGNVGIGTTNPVRKLVISNSGAEGTEISPSSGYTQIISYNRSTSSYVPLILQDANTAGKVGIGTTTPANRLDVEGALAIGSTYSGTTAAPTNGAIIEGNVGIGTNAPVDPLDVTTSTQHQTVFAINNTSSGSNYAGNFWATGSGTANYALAAYTNGGATSNCNLFLSTLASATNNYSLYSAAAAKSYFAGSVGIGTTTPAQKLDVAGTVQMTGFKLTSSPTAGYVLTSDANGVGTWLPAAGGGVTGSCSSGANYVPKMSGSTAITCSQIYDNGTNVGVNTSSPAAKLDVENDVYNGCAVKGYSAVSTGTNYGGQFYARGTGVENYALYADASEATRNFGLFIAGANADANDYAIYSTMNAKSFFAGSVGIGTASPTHQLQLSNDDGAKPSTGTWTIVSDARLKNVDGAYTKGLKEILQLNPILYHYKNVDSTVTFTNKVLNTQNCGFIAQDVQQIFPEAVKVDTLGYLNLNIHPILIAFVNAFKEQQATIDSLKQNQKTTDSLLTQQKAIDSMQTIALNNMALHQQTTDALLNQQRAADSLLTETVNNLMATVTNCCSQNSTPKMMLNNNGQTQSETLQVELTNNNQTILFQNQPNPFNESTVIRYFIPENITGSAFVIFYDVYGQEIKRTEIATKGFGNINVNAENLLSGVYSYSLLIDGKIIDTKKMIKNK